MNSTCWLPHEFLHEAAVAMLFMMTSVMMTRRKMMMRMMWSFHGVPYLLVL